MRGPWDYQGWKYPVHAVNGRLSSLSPPVIGVLVVGPSVVQNAVIVETSIARSVYHRKYLEGAVENDSFVLAADHGLGLAKMAA
jgi:hypothetical protein